MTTFLLGLALGVAGGVHCVAMCGPLVAAVAPRGRRAVIHHMSRGLTYIVLGLVAGTAGMGAASIGLNRAVSWIAAGLILSQAAAPLFGASRAQSTRIAQAVAILVFQTRALSRRYPWSGPALLGALNGLLPCGLVYSATLAALGLGDAGSGAWFMAGFAGGTSGVLAIAGAMWSRVSDRLPLSVYRLAPIALTAVALFLVLRGWAAAPLVHGGH